MSQCSFGHVKITGISTLVPEKTVHIEDELYLFNNDPKVLKRNQKVLGFSERHVIDERTTNTDLCEAAACDLLSRLKVDRSEIDTLIAVSSSHDYHYPATACVLQGLLDLPEECACFDVSGLACSAYVHGLWLAHSLIVSGAAKKVLLCAGDITSTHSDPHNRNTHPIFGDAASATLLEYSNEPRQAYFLMGTRGKDFDKLIAPAGGYALPIREDIAGAFEVDDKGNVWHLWDDIMKGFDVFQFATRVGPAGIARVLEQAGLSTDGVDYFAIHQANKQIVNTIAMYSKLPKDKYSTDAFLKYGNCGTASVVTDINHSLCGRRVSRVCLTTFGVGLSWGFALLDFKDTQILPIGIYRTPEGKLTREQKIAYWNNFFKEGNHA